MLLAATAVFVLVGASARAADSPLPSSVDFAQLAFIWTCMFSADVTMRRNAHIRIDVLLLKLPARLQRTVELVFVLVEIAFMVVLVKYGVKLALSNWQRPLGATGLSYAWVTFAVPFGGVLLVITLLRHLLQIVINPDAKADVAVSDMRTSEN
ncbi:TRAP transporter small permease [Salinisphaera sp. SWV1]|uniref:TRAP transporter small permease n=1 Tax=Salinisphaera sp. SWV1 TaxID=3454139 RepID=UPI003F826890